MQLPKTTSTESPLPAPPSFWSAEFHLRFFPKQLWANVKNHPDARKGHIFFEIPIALAVFFFLIAYGLPSALTTHSIVGWVCLILGVGGFIALLVYCLKSAWGEPLLYSEYEPWTFFLFVFLGLFGGLGAAQLITAYTFYTHPLCALIGLGLGYGLGIPAGLMAQKLGPLRAYWALLSGLGVIVGFFTALIWLFYIR